MAVYDDALFRATFPEFKDPVQFPEPMIDAYWDMATMFISDVETYWASLKGKRLATALNMMTAHLMTLGRAQRGGGGKTPGAKQGGFTTGATVGEVSVTKLAPPASDGWEWWLAQTPYGQMLWALLQLLAVGGLSVGGLPEYEAFRKTGGVFL